METSATGDLGKIFTRYWRPLLLCVALVAAYNITDYMLLSYMPTYLSDELGYGTTHGLLILLVVMVLQMCVMNQVGRLSDRFGRKPLLMTGMLGFLFLSVPAFLLIRTGQRRPHHRGPAPARAVPGDDAGHDVRGASGDLPHPGPLRLPLGRLQPLHVALRGHDPPGDHRSDQRASTPT
ncbi:hypothetical protein SGLAM104S_08788 [Streptomyces glaucescens]